MLLQLRALGAPPAQPCSLKTGLQGVLGSSSTIVQLRAFARVRGPEGRQDSETDWEVLYLALRCGYYQEAVQVPSGLLLHLLCCPTCTD